MKQKTLSLLLMFTLLGSLTACGTTAATTTTDNTSAESESSDTAINLEPTVLYDDNNLLITMTAFDDMSIYPGFDISIENNSDQDVLVSTDRVAINHTMISAGLGQAVASTPGDVMEDTIYLDPETLLMAGITTDNMFDLELEVELYKPESDTNLYDPVRLEIPLRETEAEKKDGNVLAENEDYRITEAEFPDDIKELQTEGNYTGKFYRIENLTDTDMVITATDSEGTIAYSMGYGWASEKDQAEIFPGDDCIVYSDGPEGSDMEITINGESVSLK